ncbi:hypothetical protein CJ030_MR1G016572 [Morella rubra]|uniref:Uncharacterized protein n=1 Tax=Morella rubra TaxID=262757 RepID=A0A6A1WV22_9ROSI|nr:hypothetical protein CJ030_MR1G016572 [Morella rubra]
MMCRQRVGVDILFKQACPRRGAQRFSPLSLHDPSQQRSASSLWCCRGIGLAIICCVHKLWLLLSDWGASWSKDMETWSLSNAMLSGCKASLNCTISRARSATDEPINKVIKLRYNIDLYLDRFKKQEEC